MDRVYGTMLGIALPAAIAAFAVAIILYIVSLQLSKSRHELRTIRIALEHDPSPAQIDAASKLFPEAAKYPPNQRTNELARQCSFEEGRRVQRIELVLGTCRTFLGIGALLTIFVIAGHIWPPGGKP